MSSSETLSRYPMAKTTGEILDGGLEDSKVSDEKKGAGDDESPIEMLCEEVDMNDPKMDPLEWTARKIIPIPRAYYWETGNTSIPFKIKCWHHLVAGLGAVTRFAEKAGEIVANVTGLNSSRFEYVTSTMTEEEWEAARRNAQNQKERREIFLAEKKKRMEEEQAAADAGLKPAAI